MWIKASELQKGDKIFSIGEILSTVSVTDNGITIYASERIVSTTKDAEYWVESLAFEPEEINQ